MHGVTQVVASLHVAVEGDAHLGTATTTALLLVLILLILLVLITGHVSSFHLVSYRLST